MEITDNIKNISGQIAQIYRDNIFKNDAKATGTLSRFSWMCRFSGGFYELIFTLPDYWKYAPENERPKGAKQPPTEEIEKWIIAKRLPVPTTKKGVPKIKGMAFCIARKIKENGYKNQPRKILQNSLLEADERGLINKLTTEIFNALTEEINNEITQL